MFEFIKRLTARKFTNAIGKVLINKIQWYDERKIEDSSLEA